MRALLSQAGVDTKEREFFEDRLSEEELRRLIGDRPASDVFSWKSPAFKALGLDRDDLSDQRLLRLMLDEPRLIRRPIVVVDGEVIDGRDSAALERALG